MTWLALTLYLLGAWHDFDFIRATRHASRLDWIEALLWPAGPIEDAWDTIRGRWAARKEGE